MAKYANQKTVEITEHEKCDAEHPYVVRNVNALQDAMKQLSGNEFKLWMYLNKNARGFRLEVSAADAANWGMANRTFYRSWEALEKYGYLEKVENKFYKFYERPHNPTIYIVECIDE